MGIDRMGEKLKMEIGHRSGRIRLYLIQRLPFRVLTYIYFDASSGPQKVD